MINRRYLIKIALVLIITLFFTFSFSTISYASGNNTAATAIEIVDDQSFHGVLSNASDFDWFKIKFNVTGMANFYLGSIPSNCDYDLEVYKNNGNTLLAKSEKGGNASETIRCRVNANQYYYLKIVSSQGYAANDSYLIRGKVYSTTSGKIFSFNYVDSEGYSINSTPSAQVAMNYIWNMKYSGSVYENNTASTAYGAMIGTSIFCVINHANAGYISFSKPVSGSSTVETTYLYGSSSSHPSVSQYITNTRLSEMELAIYAGCYSGNTSSGGSNLVDATLSAGAKSCIGFGDEILISYTHLWIEQFFKYCRDGYGGDYTILSAMMGAYEYVDFYYESTGGLDDIKFGTSIVANHIIGGNY